MPHLDDPSLRVNHLLLQARLAAQLCNDRVGSLQKLRLARDFLLGIVGLSGTWQLGHSSQTICTLYSVLCGQLLRSTSDFVWKNYDCPYAVGRARPSGVGYFDNIMMMFVELCGYLAKIGWGVC